MKRFDSAFEPKNLFRNPYFWVAAAGVIFLTYVLLIAFAILPRTTPEVLDGSANQRTKEGGETLNDSGNTKRSNSLQNDGELSKARVKLITNGGWIDTDNHEMTIVLRVSGLSAEVIDEIIRSGLVRIGIDEVPAEIINSEPNGKNGFLTRAKAVLQTDKFENFRNGETQRVELTTTLKYRQETKTEVIGKRFAKREKTEAEGVRIAWK